MGSVALTVVFTDPHQYTLFDRRSTGIPAPQKHTVVIGCHACMKAQGGNVVKIQPLFCA